MYSIRSPGGHISSADCPDPAFAALAWARARGEKVTLLTEKSIWSGWAVLPDSLDAAQQDAVARSRTVAELQQIPGLALAAVESDPRIRPAVTLLDRDGTIIEDRHYLADPKGVVLLPHALESLSSLAAGQIRIVVVSNQSGVGRGRVTPEQLDAVNARMHTLLAAGGVRLGGIYSCPHVETDNCDCRKPKPGLARRAAAELGLDLSRAVVAGDKAADIGLAQALGVPSFLVLTGEGMQTAMDPECHPDYIVDDLAGVARICLAPSGLLRIVPILTLSA